MLSENSYQFDQVRGVVAYCVAMLQNAVEDNAGEMTPVERDAAYQLYEQLSAWCDEADEINLAAAAER